MKKDTITKWGWVAFYMSVYLFCPDIAVGASREFSPGKTEYFVDQKNGDNKNSGTSEYYPWKTIERLNRVNFAPGDKVHFSGGQTFKGNLKLSNIHGEADKLNVVFTTLGYIPAVIDAGKGPGLVLEDSENVKFEKLTFRGAGRKNGNEASGVTVRLCEDITFDNITASGFLWSGINLLSGKNLRLTKVHAHDNGFAGISAGPSTLERTISNLYLGHCTSENNPGCPAVRNGQSGSGIIIGGTRGALIEHCEAKNNGWDMQGEDGGPVGIWAWNSDDVTIQHCIAHDNKTSENAVDGGGFSLDGGMTNSRLQYNLSYNNMGPGYGLFQFTTGPPWKNNTIAYNISINDGIGQTQAGVYIWTANEFMADANIYNNTIINNGGFAVIFQLDHEIANFHFFNNIFISPGKGGSFLMGDRSDSSFDKNLFWALSGNTAEVAFDSQAIVKDPLITFPDFKEELLWEPLDPRTFRFCRQQANSPCARAGLPHPEKVTYDFFGNRVPPHGPIDIGAHQSSK